jgi:hypothetical protein
VVIVFLLRRLSINDGFHNHSTVHRNPQDRTASQVSANISSLDHYSTLITALGTLAIAAFTWTLWQATDKLREAGEKQTELTEIPQRAYINAEPRGIHLLVQRDRVIGHIGTLKPYVFGFWDIAARQLDDSLPALSPPSIANNMANVLLLAHNYESHFRT